MHIRPMRSTSPEPRAPIWPGTGARMAARAAVSGLRIHVTELDINPTAASYYGNATEAQQLLDVQAEVYASVLRVCAREPACDAFVLWAPTDAHTDRGNLTEAPGQAVIDSWYRPKPSFWSLANALEQKGETGKCCK